MASSSTFTLGQLRLSPTSSIADPKPNPTSPSYRTNQTSSDPQSEPQVRKLKGSSKLNRWSMARAIRSGRKLDRPVQRNQSPEVNSPVTNGESSSPSSSSTTMGGSNGEDEEELGTAKLIYMVSDGTGWTAEHSVNAALGQFDYCLVDRACSVNTHLFSGVIN